MLARAFAVSIVFLSSFPVAAQQAQTPPVVYQLKLEAKQVGDIAEALGMLPYSRVAPLMQEIGRQVEEQNKARAPQPQEVPK